MSPGLTTIVLASAATCSAVLGVVPFLRGARVSRASLGWANALAGGLMLGTAYALTVAIPTGGVVAAFGGALVGAATLFAFRIAFAPADLEVDGRGEAPPDSSARVLFLAALHSAAEGVAIGVAVLLDLTLGIMMAVTLAIHNIPEATALVGTVGPASLSALRRAGLALAINLPQVVLAMAAFGLVHAEAGTLPWVAGFALGALVYLVIADLLPLAYREAGHTSIALVVSAALGVVVLIESLVI